MTYLIVSGDRWKLDRRKATPFMVDRVRTMVKTGYLEYERTVRSWEIFKIIGGMDQYLDANNQMISVGWKQSFTQGRVP